MASRDLRPDMTGQQLVHTFTIAFSAGAEAVQLLEHTARVGGGTVLRGGACPNRCAMACAMRFGRLPRPTAQLHRAAGARGIPLGRGSLYRAYFKPDFDTAFWEGHLEHRDFSTGRDDGTLHWDAGTALQSVAPSVRDLRVSLSTLSAGDTLPLFNTNDVPRNEVFARADQLQGFGVPPTPVVTTFDNTDPDALHEVALATLRVVCMPTSGAGCVSRATPVAAGTARADGTALLGDIFHSRPVVVGAPRGVSAEVSYAAFRQSQRTRVRRVFVGANDGFLHAFDAGSWNAVQQRYDPGSGAEQFGFMPWPVRPGDSPSSCGRCLTATRAIASVVDGSPSASDVWFYNNDLNIQNKKADGSEWRTVVIGGLRRGGNAYFALDVTRAGVGANGVRYLWEYPQEGAGNALIGQTWARPIVAKVKARYNGAARERWVAVLTGGYDERGDPNHGAYDARGGRGSRDLFDRHQDGGRAGTETAAPGDGGGDCGHGPPGESALRDGLHAGGLRRRRGRLRGRDLRGGSGRERVEVGDRRPRRELSRGRGQRSDGGCLAAPHQLPALFQRQGDGGGQPRGGARLGELLPELFSTRRRGCCGARRCGWRSGAGSGRIWPARRDPTTAPPRATNHRFYVADRSRSPWIRISRPPCRLRKTGGRWTRGPLRPR